jgi:hypothetical protein
MIMEKNTHLFESSEPFKKALPRVERYMVRHLFELLLSRCLRSCRARD